MFSPDIDTVRVPHFMNKSYYQKKRNIKRDGFPH